MDRSGGVCEVKYLNLQSRNLVSASMTLEEFFVIT